MKVNYEERRESEMNSSGNQMFGQYYLLVSQYQGMPDLYLHNCLLFTKEI